MAANLHDRFTKDLSDLLKARFPYIHISTWEEERLLKVINAICKDETVIKTPRKVFAWSLTKGISNNEIANRKETKEPLKALDFIEQFPEAAVFIFKDFHIYFSPQNRCFDNEIIRKLRDLIEVLKNSPRPKNIIFVSSNSTLPNELQKDVTLLEFDLPTAREIEILLDELIDVNKKSGRIQIILDPSEKEKLAKAALGLTLQEAENAFAHAMVEDGYLNSKDIDIVLEEKCQIIKKTGILEYIKSNFKLEDVGGLQNLKRWLIKRNKSWLDSAKRYCLPAPKGVLLTGVPGCGKSLTAKAVSAMWQLPLLRLDMGRIFSGIVGSSEENIRKAIKTAEAIAPSILWIDEIEKGFSGIGSSGDSGVATRIFGTILTWMQEKTEPVFVVATANNISMLPPELLRKGRFDEIFFIDLPTHVERKDIFRIQISKKLIDPFVIGNFVLTDEVLDNLAKSTEGFVGAEIEHVVTTALYDAFFEDRSIRIDDLMKAINNVVPLSITQAEQIKSLRDWANVRAVAATPREDRMEYVVQNEKPADDSNSSPKELKDPIKESRGGRTIDF